MFMCKQMNDSNDTMGRREERDLEDFVNPGTKRLKKNSVLVNSWTTPKLV